MIIKLPDNHNYTTDRLKRTINRNHESVIEVPLRKWHDNGWNVVLVCFVMLAVFAWGMA